MAWADCIDFDTVVSHLDAIDSLANVPKNKSMLDEIRAAIAGGRQLSVAQHNFMTHELTEANAMANGTTQLNAHEVVLKTYPTYMNYSPEVISQYPTEFNNGYRAAWGMEPR